MTTALIALLALSQTADAGRGGRGGGAPDLAVTVSAPALVDVYDAATLSVRVENHGSANADGVSLVIALPETATSPTVHVLGDLSAVDGRCVQVGTALECSLGRIRAGRSETVTFAYAAPWAGVALDIDAEATAPGEANAADNIDGVTLDVVYVDSPIDAPAGVTNRHCTGTGLQAFYECTLYPSSISTHDILLNADGSMGFPPGISGYTGSWWQDTDDHLHFEYEALGMTRLVFDGNGVGGDCFEGLSEFPGTGYNAGYEVCFREL
ncbi:MAG: hypothetical protein H6742_03810 [Alphaproteobacteria bacterium]|nr:hypothetical protein [Alphaproteobacteria bacterium]